MPVQACNASTFSKDVSSADSTPPLPLHRRPKFIVYDFGEVQPRAV
jgi:hypothetical protein